MIHLQIHPFALGIRVLCQLLAETLILEQGDHIGRIAGAALGPQLFQQRAEGLGKVVAPTDIIGGSESATLSASTIPLISGGQEGTSLGYPPLPLQ